MRNIIISEQIYIKLNKYITNKLTAQISQITLPIKIEDLERINEKILTKYANTVIFY